MFTLDSGEACGGIPAAKRARRKHGQTDKHGRLHHRLSAGGTRLDDLHGKDGRRTRKRLRGGCETRQKGVLSRQTRRRRFREISAERAADIRHRHFPHRHGQKVQNGACLRDAERERRPRIFLLPRHAGGRKPLPRRSEGRDVLPRRRAALLLRVPARIPHPSRDKARGGIRS